VDRIDWKKLDEFERNNSERICRHFFGRGKKNGLEWKLGDVGGAPGDSLGVQLAGERAGLWHDRATGEGGKLRKLIAMNRALSDWDTVQEIEHAFGATFRENGSGNSNGSFDWNACVMAMAGERKVLRELGSWRGLSDEFCSWLVAHKLLGLYKGCIAFPIHDKAGNVVGPHYLINREQKSWRYTTGARAAALVIGKAKSAEEYHIHESTWDGLAYCDRSEAYLSSDVCVIVTRGASHAKTVRGLIPSGKKTYVWPQNDKPDIKTGKIASEEWFNAVAENLEGSFYRVQTPVEFEDLNAWTLNGASQLDLDEAKTLAQICGAKKEEHKEKDSTRAEHATELELAQILTRSLPSLRCVDENWYVYKNGYWNKNEKSLYKPLALQIQHERSRKARTAANVLSHVEYQHQVGQSSFRSFYHLTPAGEILLNCRNGVLCVTLQSTQLLEHSSDYNFTGQIAAAYDPDAEPKVFERVLQETLTEPADILLFRAFVGSILLPDCRFEAALCCYGPTGTAKSTLASGIKAALGPDLITNLTLQQICDPKCFHLYKLNGAAVNIATELNALAVSSENYKRIISGEAIDADRKYLASVNLETTSKLWFLTNELPKFMNGTDAELRRLRFLRFVPRNWPIDTTLKGRIQNEKDGVFSFMVTGLREVLSMSEMPFGAERSRRTRERFQVQNDPLGTFVSTCCTLNPEAEEFKSRIIEAYGSFCSDNGIPAPSAPEPFFRRLYERYPVQVVRRRDNDQRVQKIVGITLNED
jgi:P4 family phage/plasmid primase-like protien